MVSIPARTQTFIEQGTCKFVGVKTQNDDKYGRYLVDVFYKIGENDPAIVAAEGIFLNQELLDNRFAVKW